MELVVQAVKVLGYLVHAETNTRSTKSLQKFQLLLHNDLWESACMRVS